MDIWTSLSGTAAASEYDVPTWVSRLRIPRAHRQRFTFYFYSDLVFYALIAETFDFLNLIY